MCAICGCSTDDHDSHTHDPTHDHGNPHVHGPHRSVVSLEQDVLAKNDRLALANRLWLAERNILALNLMSSPGAGKTTLLERIIGALGKELSLDVIEGDQATDRDAQRIRRAGSRAVQVNTGAGCHLDAAMVAKALVELDPAAGGLLAIENVGNLVCPALFDLGERFRLVITSVTEGDDKPIKYPHMFRASDVMLLNKIDLLPYVDFDVERCVERARSINPLVRVFPVSATRGDGLDAFHAWLRSETTGLRS
jgi:hydrogenase nickel incorporation protein HypB